jgi:hypothetical protein
LGETFFKECGTAVAEITRRYGVACSTGENDLIKLDGLNACHMGWKRATDREFADGLRALDWRWQRALQTLAVHLCQWHDLAYERNLPVPPALRKYQDLVLAHPGIFTALRFVRNQYLKILLQNSADQTENAQEKVQPIVNEYSHFETVDLEEFILLIRERPAEAGDFVSWLRLPQPPRRG